LILLSLAQEFDCGVYLELYVSGLILYVVDVGEAKRGLREDGASVAEKGEEDFVQHFLFIKSFKE
jgi:hypothetical protein